MNEQKSPLPGRFMLLTVIAAVCGLAATRLFLLPELSVFFGLPALCIYCGVQGTLISTVKPRFAYFPAVLCFLFAAFAGDDAGFALLNISFALLAAALLGLFTRQKTPHHVVFTTLCVLFCAHILVVLGVMIYEYYGALNGEIIRTAVNDAIESFISQFREALDKASSDPLLERMPTLPDTDALLETLTFSIRSSILNVICLLGMIPAAVSTIFYELSVRILGEDAAKKCLEDREWLYLPPHALSYFFYLVYFGYVLFMFIDNEPLFIAFGSLSFVLSLPLGYVGLRFAAWLLNTRIKSKGLVRFIVIGGAVITTMTFGSLRITAALAAFFGAFVSLRTRVMKNNDSSGGNE